MHTRRLLVACVAGDMGFLLVSQCRHISRITLWKTLTTRREFQPLFEPVLMFWQKDPLNRCGLHVQAMGQSLCDLRATFCGLGPPPAREVKRASTPRSFK